MKQAVEYRAALTGQARTRSAAGQGRARTTAGGPRALVRWAEANGADLAGLQVRRPGLGDVYLSLTQTH
jgi:hypothetical protein